MTDARGRKLVTTGLLLCAAGVMAVATARRRRGAAALASMEQARLRTHGHSTRHDPQADQARLLRMHHLLSEGASPVQVEVRNDSSAAFADVQVTGAHLLLSTVPEALTAELSGDTEVAALAPGDTAAVGVAFRDAAGAPVDPAGRHPAVEVRYTDARGVRWRRLGGAPPRRDD